MGRQRKEGQRKREKHFKFAPSKRQVPPETISRQEGRAKKIVAAGRRAKRRREAADQRSGKQSGRGTRAISEKQISETSRKRDGSIRRRGI